MTYRIPAGTSVEFNGGNGWQQHTTEKDWDFAERMVDSFGVVLFARGEWRVRVASDKVQEIVIEDCGKPVPVEPELDASNTEVPF